MGCSCYLISSNLNKKAKIITEVGYIIVVIVLLYTAFSTSQKMKDQIYTQAINAYQIGDVYKTPDGTWHQKFIDYD